MKKFFFAFVLYLFAAFQPAQAGVSCSVPFNLTNGTTADASQVMANYNAILACLLNSTAASGANSDITALLGLTTPLSNAQGGTATYIATATSTGSANAQTVAATLPSGFALTQGWQVVFYAGFSNTGPMTLLVNGQTVASTTSPVCSSGTCPPSLYRRTPSGPQAMTGGEVIAGQLYVAIWDGTYFELNDSSSQFGGYGPVANIASATTTDLGSVVGHFISVNGTTPITSFGASASLTYPIYFLYFSGAVTISYNATSCSTVGNCITTPNNANITTVAGDTAIVGYNGKGSGGGGNWVFLSYNRASGQPIVSPTPLCGANNLKIVNDASTPNSSIDITADSTVLLNAGNVPVYATAVSVVINDTINGANGLDTGSLANSTWYYHWLISNGTVTAGLDSLSSTFSGLTLPTGYTYGCRLGAGITNGSANFLRTRQLGRDVQYVVGTNPSFTPNIANGTAGTYSLTSPTLAAVSVTGVVPPTASMLYGVAGTNYQAGTSGALEVAPTTAWGGTNRGPTGSVGNIYPAALPTGTGATSLQFSLVLETTTIAWASNNTGAAISALGWRDQVNAN